MSELFNQVKETFKQAQKEIEETGGRMVAEINEDFDNRNLVYYAMADVSVIASQIQYKDCTEEHTGPVEVDNVQSMVIIDGIEIRGDVQFEILQDGKWIAGHRENSQYGQVMRGVILHNQIQGKVVLPLKHDC